MAEIERMTITLSSDMAAVVKGAVRVATTPPAAR
jgi:hypothetical protein